MHTVLLGIVRTLTYEMFEPKFKKKTYYLTPENIEHIDEEWLNVKVNVDPFA